MTSSTTAAAGRGGTVVVSNRRYYYVVEEEEGKFNPNHPRYMVICDLVHAKVHTLYSTPRACALRGTAATPPNNLYIQ